MYKNLHNKLNTNSHVFYNILFTQEQNDTS
jgi:hypothetical protein